MKSEVCFVGIGNEFRSDDGVGLAVVRDLEQKYSERCPFYYFQEDTISILSLFELYSRIVIVDAVVTGEKPGTIHRLDLTDHIPDSVEMKFSGHILDIFDVLRMEKELYGSYPEIHFFGIEGINFHHGTEMNDDVKIAADRLTEKLGREYMGV